MGIALFFILIVAVFSVAFFYVNVSEKHSKAYNERKVEHDEATRQIWLKYMNVEFPLLQHELVIWNAMSYLEKKAWIKKFKEDIRLGKKIPVKDDAGKVVAYKVKDKKTIIKEATKEELTKKVFKV